MFQVSVMGADFDDGGSVVDESGWGTVADYNFAHLPPAARKKARERQRRLHERWRRAQTARATWTPEQFEEEKKRIDAEIAEILAARDAA